VAALRAQPAYAPFVEMVARHAGPDAKSLLSAYFVCDDLTELTGLVQSAGLQDAREVLRPFATSSGAVEVPLEGHLVAARRMS
jgi:hypothetical protein